MTRQRLPDVKNGATTAGLEISFATALATPRHPGCVSTPHRAPSGREVLESDLSQLPRRNPPPDRSLCCCSSRRSLRTRRSTHRRPTPQSTLTAPLPQLRHSSEPCPHLTPWLPSHTLTFTLAGPSAGRCTWSTGARALAALQTVWRRVRYGPMPSRRAATHPPFPLAASRLSPMPPRRAGGTGRLTAPRMGARWIG